MGLTRDTASLMVGQYFKRRREAVEIALVGSSGVGLALMTVFLHTTLGYKYGFALYHLAFTVYYSAIYCECIYHLHFLCINDDQIISLELI